MVLKINPNQQALWRDPFQLQIGVGKNALRLGKLSAAQERLIAALYRGIADQQLPLVSKQLGLSTPEVDSLLSQVGGLLELEPPQLNSKIRLNDDFVASAFAEIIRASLLHAVDGEAVLIGRADRTIHIDELSSSGLGIALALAAAGIGKIFTSDDKPVVNSNLGATGYPTQFLGHPRIDALRSLLAASPNQMQTNSSVNLPEKSFSKIDCAILIGQQVIEPRRYEAWLRRGTPHLAITFDAESVSVSPLIVPGATACLMCLEKMRTETDPQWPVLASQMITSNKKFDDAAGKLFAAGLAVQKILAHADRIAGFTPHEQAVGYRLELANGKVSELAWPKNSTCDCR
ncbi:MAG: hypothetical protein ACKOWH_01770 [Rhodoluna sp.]